MLQDRTGIECTVLVHNFGGLHVRTVTKDPSVLSGGIVEITVAELSGDDLLSVMIAEKFHQQLGTGRCLRVAELVVIAILHCIHLIKISQLEIVECKMTVDFTDGQLRFARFQIDAGKGHADEFARTLECKLTDLLAVEQQRIGHRRIRADTDRDVIVLGCGNLHQSQNMVARIAGKTGKITCTAVAPAHGLGSKKSGKIRILRLKLEAGFLCLHRGDLKLHHLNGGRCFIGGLFDGVVRGK